MRNRNTASKKHKQKVSRYLDDIEDYLRNEEEFCECESSFDQANDLEIFDVSDVDLVFSVAKEKKAYLSSFFHFDRHTIDSNGTDHVDLTNFQASLVSEGHFFIWTCSCGEPGCTARFNGVLVEHTQTKTRWLDLDRDRQFYFDKTVLKQAMEHSKTAFEKVYRQFPEVEVIPLQNAKFFGVI